MGIDITRLSQAAQKQALQKLQQQAQLSKNHRQLEGQKSKYGNTPTHVGGIRFDSRKEAERYQELALLLHSGEISDLRLQPQFTLQEGYKTDTGETVRAIRYYADFSFVKDGKLCVEDVKSAGTRTKEYSMKKKMMLDKFGIKIQEV